MFLYPTHLARRLRCCAASGTALRSGGAPGPSSTAWQSLARVHSVVSAFNGFPLFSSHPPSEPSVASAASTPWCRGVLGCTRGLFAPTNAGAPVLGSARQRWPAVMRRWWQWRRREERQGHETSVHHAGAQAGRWAGGSGGGLSSQRCSVVVPHAAAPCGHATALHCWIVRCSLHGGMMR